MKIGYPCKNMTVECKADSTFRLASYSEERLRETVAANLQCLREILQQNLENGLLFFRLSSDTVPFASHEVCAFDWQTHFRREFEETGSFIKQQDMRISMHPSQFTLLNSPHQEITQRSIAELQYHADVLDLLQLDASAKIQIHAGGVYGDKPAAIRRFGRRYTELDESIRRRLVIENDERLYSVDDCLAIHENFGVPVLFDSFHHQCLNNGESVRKALQLCANTWKPNDGLLMIDYSSQQPDARRGKHIESIDPEDFRRFIHETMGLDFDIMLEIKDKEASALKALRILREEQATANV